ncbi:MAG: hypothetical protein C0616_12315 [Desulfuromonas sp.]|nr:MAG: hypothetical protein C0616_12315 [Desulfuromonas sp.]
MYDFVIKGAVAGVAAALNLLLVIDFWQSFSLMVAFGATLAQVVLLTVGLFWPRLYPPLAPECAGKGGKR